MQCPGVDPQNKRLKANTGICSDRRSVLHEQSHLSELEVIMFGYKKADGVGIVYVAPTDISLAGSGHSMSYVSKINLLHRIKHAKKQNKDFLSHSIY